MRKLIIPALLLATTAFATSANAQSVDVSGEIEAKSSYTLGDYLYVGSADPVVQGSLDAEVKLSDTVACRASGWGNLSTNGIGHEIDLGAGCTANIDEKTTVTVTGTRYFLLDHGVPDMTAITTTVTHGRVDINAGVYLWDHRPDGYAANVGYTLPVANFRLRGSVHYAHGLGDDDIVFLGGQVTYPITSHLTASVNGYLPIIKTDRDTRSARVVAGLSLSF